jgi:hypothetical protein
MDNETTMPGLLTLPGALSQDARRSAARFSLYKLIFVVAVLALAMVLWMY